VKLDVKAFSNNVEISWVTPVDAVKQEIKFSTTPIDTTNFDNANSFVGVPVVAQGQKQNAKISDLKENVTYYIAYKYYEVDQERTKQVQTQKKSASRRVDAIADKKFDMFEVSAIDASEKAQVVNDNEVTAEIAPVTKSTNTVNDVNDADVQYKTGYAFAVATTNDKDLTAPEAVSDLTYTASADTITISWTAPSDKDLDSYIIKYNTSLISKDTLATDGSVANVPVGLPGQKQSIKVDGLSKSKVYYFAVIAKDFSGNMSPMNTIEAGTDGAVVLQTQPSVNAITLLWLTPSNVVAHEMRYSTQAINDSNYFDANVVPNFPALLAGQNQMVTVGQLTPFTTYYFAYRYQTNDGNWQISHTSAKTKSPDVGAPAAVTNLNLLAQQNNIYVSWKSPDNVDLAGFHVRYATFVIDGANFNMANVANNTPIGQPGAIQSMVLSNLQTNTRYYVAIRAVDTSGNESPITTTSAVTGSTIASGISFVAVPSVNSATLFWVTPQDIVSYRIKYSTDPIDPSNFDRASLVTSAPAPIPSQLQSATVGQLTPNTKYYFAYKGVVAGGSEFYSYASTSTLTSDVTAPSPVSFFGLVPDKNSILLRWTSPMDDDLAGFHVRYATYELNSRNFNSGSVANNTPIGVPGDDQEMTIDGLKTDTMYWVGIMAVDRAGNESILRVNAVTTLSGGSSGGGSTGGGGGGGGGAVYYGAFIGPYTVQINGGNGQTFSRNVGLKVDCGGNAKSMAISNYADLSGAQIVDYKQTYPWTITEGVGTKTVYARCYGYEGQSSPIVSDSIELVSGTANYTAEEIANIVNNGGQVLGVKIRPDNTLVRTPDEKVFLISNGGKKTRIVSLFDLYYRFKGQPIENITFAELAQYPDLNKNVLGTKVFTNGTLVRAEDYRVYVIENGYKKYLPTLEDVKAYKGKKIQNVTYTDLAQYPVISNDTARHNNFKIGEGTMIRDSKGNIFVIRNGERNYIPGYAEAFERFANVPVVNVSDEVIAKYPLDGPYPHNGKAYIGLGIYSNGTLIRTPDNKIFEVIDGYGDPVSYDQLKTKYEGRKIIDVNQYFAIPSPKPLY
jgi:hypothetical protein